MFEKARYLETVFPDGTKVPAAPQDTQEYVDRACELGYLYDPDPAWSMCRSHEIAHTRLSQLLGEPYSQTLWAVAHGHHGGIPGSKYEMAAEEALVLAYQRWMLITVQRRVSREAR